MRTSARPSTSGDVVTRRFPFACSRTITSVVARAETDSIAPGIKASLMKTIGSRWVSARRGAEATTERITRSKTSSSRSVPDPAACAIALWYVRSVASASTAPSRASRLPTQR